jgi:predicted nucleotidyltransferase
MNEELDVLQIVTKRLKDLSIEYMISGSIACNYYTIPRMTRDIDIVLEILHKNIKQFIRLFEDDFYVDHDVITEEVNKRGMFNCIHKEFALKVDFIVRKETDFQKSMFARKKEININGHRMWIVSPEDLVVMKLLWAKDSLSELQLMDVKNLLNSVEDFDQVYIEKWVSFLNLDKVWEKSQQ